jgi:hypothetical protein
MPCDRRTLTSTLRRLLREPTVHFFAIAALLFIAHRLLLGDPRVVVIRPGLRAELDRRLRDQLGRPPTSGEMTTSLDGWKRDEALYREALAERLDREDATVRIVLADKMRARAVQEMPKHEPTDAELKEFLAAHRADYEMPLQYDFELVTFPKKDATAADQRASFQRGLAAGMRPSMLGRPVISGTVTRQDLTEKFGPAVSAGISGLTPGPESWTPIEDESNLLLVRLNRIDGGLSSFEVLRPRLQSDWESAARKQAVERMTEAVVKRYRFEDKP